jgi:hypothetical protein
VPLPAYVNGAAREAGRSKLALRREHRAVDREHLADAFLELADDRAAGADLHV